jgi:hypothetical protein
MPAEVRIAGGEYYLGREGTLDLGPEDGHTRWVGSAEGSAPTVISGGYVLDTVGAAQADSTLAWTPLQHNGATIYSAVLPKSAPMFSSLFDRGGARRLVR